MYVHVSLDVRTVSESGIAPSQVPCRLGSCVPNIHVPVAPRLHRRVTSSVSLDAARSDESLVASNYVSILKGFPC